MLNHYLLSAFACAWSPPSPADTPTSPPSLSRGIETLGLPTDTASDLVRIRTELSDPRFAETSGWFALGPETSKRKDEWTLKRLQKIFIVDGAPDDRSNSVKIPALSPTDWENLLSLAPSDPELDGVVALLVGESSSSMFASCTATMISSRWVVTAAHCLDQAPTAIVIGRTLNHDATIVEVDRAACFIRPRISEATGPACGSLTRSQLAARGSADDLALIRLAIGVPPEIASPRPYAADGLELGRGQDVARAVGYGATRVMVRRDLCTPTQRSLARLGGFFHAASDGPTIRLSPAVDPATTTHPIVAPGDSGGPLFSTVASEYGKEILFGVVSTTDCQQRHTVTAISSSGHAVWIEEITGVPPWTPPPPPVPAVPQGSERGRGNR